MKNFIQYVFFYLRNKICIGRNYRQLKIYFKIYIFKPSPWKKAWLPKYNRLVSIFFDENFVQCKFHFAGEKNTYCRKKCQFKIFEIPHRSIIIIANDSLINQLVLFISKAVSLTIKQSIPSISCVPNNLNFLWSFWRRCRINNYFLTSKDFQTFLI
jgi:hypothetical protein